MKTYDGITFCTALVVGALLIAAPVTVSAKVDEKTAINDSWLTSKTKIALFADSRIKGTQIEVETAQGKVMLRGKVDSEAARNAAADIAKGINGVKDVKNELQVVAPSKRRDVDAKDDSITARVQEQFAKDSHLKQSKVDVQTNAGVVSLTGEVPDLMTSAHASWTAWIVPGVKSVTNDLALNAKK